MTNQPKQDPKEKIPEPKTAPVAVWIPCPKCKGATINYRGQRCNYCRGQGGAWVTR